MSDQIDRIVLATARRIAAEGRRPTAKRIYHRTRGGAVMIRYQQIRRSIARLQAAGTFPDPANTEARA